MKFNIDIIKHIRRISQSNRKCAYCFVVIFHCIISTVKALLGQNQNIYKYYVNRVVLYSAVLVTMFHNSTVTLCGLTNYRIGLSDYRTASDPITNGLGLELGLGLRLEKTKTKKILFLVRCGPIGVRCSKIVRCGNW